MSNKLIASALAVGVLAMVGNAFATSQDPHQTSTPPSAYNASSTHATARTPTSTTSSPSTSSVPMVSTTPRIVALGMLPTQDAENCMLAVTMDREMAIANAFNRFSETEQNALTTRRMALEDAITNSTKHTIADAIDNAWNAYRRTRKNTVKTYREEVKTVWSQYENQIKICKKMGPLKATDKGSADDEKLED